MAVPTAVCREEFLDRRGGMNPYARVELYYDSRLTVEPYGWVGGAACPLHRRVELEEYFDYQQDTADPTRSEGAIGPLLNSTSDDVNSTSSWRYY